MIGIIKEEDITIIELNPFFARKTPKWAIIKIPYNNTTFGEYGIAWSIENKCFWIMFGNYSCPTFKNFYEWHIKPQIKRLFK